MWIYMLIVKWNKCAGIWTERICGWRYYNYQSGYYIIFYNRGWNHPQSYTLEEDSQIYLVVTKGNVVINANQIGLQDGVYVKEEKELEFIFQGDSELILLDLPNLSA